jgi:signal transduction histidine kinase
MPFFTPYTVASLLGGMFSFSIAALAYTKGRPTEEVRAFAVVSFFIGIWSFFPFLTTLPFENPVRTNLARLTYLGAIFGPPSFVWFVSAALPNEHKTLRIICRTCWIISVGLCLFGFSPLFISEVLTKEGLSGIRGGPLFHFYFVYFILVCAYAFFELLKGVGNTNGQKCTQLKYILAAFLVAYVGGGLHFLSVYTFHEPIPHDIFVIAYIAMMAYAVVKHRLMEVNLAARYGTIETLSGLLVGLPLVGLTIWIDTNLFTSIVIISLVLSGSRYFKGLRRSLTQAVDRLPMFRGRYERFGRLEDLFSDIASTKTLVEWNDTVKDVAMILCPTETTALLVKDEPGKRFIARASDGFDRADKIFLHLPMHSVLASHLSKSRNLLLAETALALCTNNERNHMEDDFRLMRSAICVPILFEGTLYAIISLGEKPNRVAFNDLELTSLTALSRAAEHALRAILSGLAQAQSSSIWAHDLIKPFTLKGSFQYLEQMLEGSFGPMSAETQQALKLILNDIGFVKQNLKQVLSPGQGDSYNIISTSLTRVYSRARENYTLESIKRHFNWRVDVPPEDLRVFCDWSMIEHRVLANLIENAFRYTPTDGTVELGWKIDDRKFVGFVKDNGIGIRENDIPKLFKARSQLEEGKGGLSGLGLFSAKSVVEAHNGRIWVESTFGKGATFFFELPLASAPHKNAKREDA